MELKNSDIILEVENLAKHFPLKQNFTYTDSKVLKAVNNVSKNSILRNIEVPSGIG